MCYRFKDMKEYVVGFLFDSRGERVVLIRKNRPDWQKGKVNGVGGKIEPNETPMAAMIREFREETGVETTSLDWENFGSMWDFHEFEIAFYRAFNSELLAQTKTCTDEFIEKWDVESVTAIFHRNQIVPNLRWLVPLALEKNQIYADLRWHQK
jgi:8-oxo-dGTP diphosphatase